MEGIIFCGIQASGKTSFYQKYYSKTHTLISLDQLKTRNKEKKELINSLERKESVVIDNTNGNTEQRETYIELFKQYGYKVIGIYFESNPQESLRRNRSREKDQRVPDIAIHTSYKRLEVPSYIEGYDELLGVSLKDGDFEITKLHQLDDLMNHKKDESLQVRQFIGVVWKDEIPFLRFYHIEKDEFYEIEALGHIFLEKLEHKFCTGYYDHQKGKECACINHIDLTNSSYHVCKNCDDLTGFTPCVMCRGNNCRSKSEPAIKRCNTDHTLYLAYFPGDKIKVGITRYARRYERMLEQGAVYSIFAGKADNGKDIRKLETAISKLGLTPQVTQTYKMKNLLEYPDSAEVKAALMDKFSFLKEHLSNRYLDWLIEPEFNDFSRLFDQICELKPSVVQYDLFGNYTSYEEDQKYEIAKEAQKIEGTIMALFGSIAMVKNQDVFTAINLKELYGWLVKLQI